MTHKFDTNIAKVVGVNAAVIFDAIRFWYFTNRENETNLHEGRYWIYNSLNAWRAIFPYFSYKQIRNALAKLEEYGLILKGQFNKNRQDRTNWYTVNEACQILSAEYQPANTACKEPDPQEADNHHLPMRADASAPEGTPSAQKGTPLPVMSTTLRIKCSDDEYVSKTRTREEDDRQPETEAQTQPAETQSATTEIPPAVTVTDQTLPEQPDLLDISDLDNHPTYVSIRDNDRIWIETLQMKSGLEVEDIFNLIKSSIEYLSLRGETPHRQSVKRLAGARLNNYKTQLLEDRRDALIKQADFNQRKTMFWNEIVDANDGLPDMTATAFYAYYGPQSVDDSGLMKFERTKRWNTKQKLLAWKARQAQTKTT